MCKECDRARDIGTDILALFKANEEAHGELHPATAADACASVMTAIFHEFKTPKENAMAFFSQIWDYEQKKYNAIDGAKAEASIMDEHGARNYWGPPGNA